jgi:parallel beta-helix repeat protein
MQRRVIRVLTTVGAMGAAFAASLVAAGAASAAGPALVFVAPTGSASGSGLSCATAHYSSIQAGVDAVRIGGDVVVCPGVYHTSVTVHHQLTLVGAPGSVIDVGDNPYGVGVEAPYTTVEGLHVQNAAGSNPNFPYDGIVTAGLEESGPVPADHVTIIGNVVSNNQGSGIDVNSSSFSTVQSNTANGNGVGVNISDDLGKRAAYNYIAGNTTDENFGGCGIALADHSGLGIIGNLITGNVSDFNGLSTATRPDASSGSGVILASPIPGGVVKNNVIQFNEFHGNGHGGVVVHSHVPNIPDGPTNDFSGNRIFGNVIGQNNLRTDESDLQTTGIYLGSASPLQITVASNTISFNGVGIFTAGPVTVIGTNFFNNDGVDQTGVPTF